MASARRLIIRLRMLSVNNWMERRRVRSITSANGGRQRLDAEAARVLAVQVWTHVTRQ